MRQLTLFGEQEHEHVVNVASVPQRSPFRYPGGKTWLVPSLRCWLSPQRRQRLGLLPVHPTQFIEPFAGGGILSLTAVAERLVEHATMVELDEDVAAVWQTILDGEDGIWLADQIVSFELTPEHIEAFLARAPLTLRERAFRT